jgi:hypothetical protein
MPNGENDLEKYLSEFRPRRVRPLPVVPSHARHWIGRLGAAALVVLSVGGGFWYARHTRKTPIAATELVLGQDTRPNAIALTRLALENEKQFQEELAAESRTILPDFRGQRGTLSVLANE